MKQYPFPKRLPWRVGFVGFLLVMLLLARDTLITHCLVGFYISQLCVVVLACVAGISFLVKNRGRWRDIFLDPRMLLVLLSTVVVLLPMVWKRDWQMMYFSFLLCLYVPIFLTYYISTRQVARYYLMILSVLAVYSVIATYFLRILPDNGLAVSTFVNSKGREFYNFGLAFVSIHEVKGRNFGIFREPGVYQFFLIVGLYLNNYVADWKKNWHMWLVNGILAVTVLSTFATGGVIEMILLIGVMFYEKKWYRDKRGLRIAVALAVSTLIVLIAVLAKGGLLAYELTGMVGKLFLGTESYSDRLTSIAIDLRLFLEKPVLGASLVDVLHAVEHNTASSLILFAGLGIPGGLLNVAAWIALVWKKERKAWVNLALLVILFMSFNTQNLTADIFFWLFPVMALTERVVPLLERRGGDA